MYCLSAVVVEKAKAFELLNVSWFFSVSANIYENRFQCNCDSCFWFISRTMSFCMRLLKLLKLNLINFVLNLSLQRYSEILSGGWQKFADIIHHLKCFQNSQNFHWSTIVLYYCVFRLNIPTIFCERLIVNKSKSNRTWTDRFSCHDNSISLFVMQSWYHLPVSLLDFMDPC